MKRNLALISICLSLTASACPQEPSTAQSITLLHQAAHCLVEGAESKKLMRHKPKILSLGSYLDTTAYPGEEALYVVGYEDSNPLRGLAFVFFVREKERRRVFRAENNASFVRKKNGIEFLEPPLGGVWTQEHMEAAIEHIESAPKSDFEVKDLHEKSSDVRCESYSDTK
ncbi:hypothetical protein [Acidicapsa acidisoli]|uniref:hypothetical protein n=1 Tax=Acidicapsa acidisoli TaxID=1615681 RepID=UPI0021DF6525|nr:hypothetical protein [Acidicapsa acidisoli]